MSSFVISIIHASLIEKGNNEFEIFGIMPLTNKTIPAAREA